jgi:hypothetical protein
MNRTIDRFGMDHRLKIQVRRERPDDHTSPFSWTVELVMRSASLQTDLGYRAAGKMIGTTIRFTQELQVHDERRPVWTTMNLTDRPDVRRRMEHLVKKAVDEALKSSDHSFEKIIPFKSPASG